MTSQCLYVLIMGKFVFSRVVIVTRVCVNFNVELNFVDSRWYNFVNFPAFVNFPT